MSKKKDESSFRKRIKRGREFERWERKQWQDEIESEAPTEWKGKRGRIDIRFLDENEGYVVVVELKATDWNKMADHRVRPNVLSHARQLWRYINSELEEYDVIPSLAYPVSPNDENRKTQIEAILNERAIQVVWRDEEYSGVSED